VVKTCADAAIGIERVTKNLRPPDHDVLGPVRQQCIDDRWTQAAIECFAAMRGDELTSCVRHLPEADRPRLVAEVTGQQATDGEVAEIVRSCPRCRSGSPLATSSWRRSPT